MITLWTLIAVECCGNIVLWSKIKILCCEIVSFVCRWSRAVMPVSHTSDDVDIYRAITADQSKAQDQF